MERIIYTCKKCGWKTSILEAWADMKPKLCKGRKCRTSFRADPDMLDISHPKDRKPAPEPKPAPKPAPSKPKAKKKVKLDDRKEERQETSED